MHHGRAAAPRPAPGPKRSRGGAHGPELLRLKLEDAERVVQTDDLGVLALLVRRELAGRALPRELLDARREVLADRDERVFELLQGPLLHRIRLDRRSMPSAASGHKRDLRRAAKRLSSVASGAL